MRDWFRNYASVLFSFKKQAISTQIQKIVLGPIVDFKLYPQMHAITSAWMVARAWRSAMEMLDVFAQRTSKEFDAIPNYRVVLLVAFDLGLRKIWIFHNSVDKKSLWLGLGCNRLFDIKICNLMPNIPYHTITLPYSYSFYPFWQFLSLKEYSN